MRTRFQALLGSTALAGAIAAAALLSSGSVRYANADVVTDTVRDMMTALMNSSQGAALPEATRTAVGAVLNSTSDGAALVAQLDNLSGQNAVLAETIGIALGKTSLSLQLSNPSAAEQLSTFVAKTANPSVKTGYSVAQLPITAQTSYVQTSYAQGSQQSSGIQVAQGVNPINNVTADDLLLQFVQTYGGGPNSGVYAQLFYTSVYTSVGRGFAQAAERIAKAFQIGPYST